MEAAEAARRACARICAEARIGGPKYEAARATMHAIDTLAEALTGDRERFWNKGHSVG